MTRSTACISQPMISTHCDGAPARPWRARLRRWYLNWRTRRQLASLDSHLLKDIGVTRAEALEEARKPFWRD